MPTLSWDEVVNYGFLAEFDLLRDTSDSVRSRPWTRPSYRLAMDTYFKILRAREEIKRLNIETKRLVTWIQDEDRFLQKTAEKYKESDPALAFQISAYWQRRGRSDHIHMQRLWALAKTPGFIGSLVPGISVERKEARRVARETQQTQPVEVEMEVEVVEEVRDRWTMENDEEWEEDNEGEEAEGETVSALLYQMSVLSVDREDGRGGNQLD
ncbi:hypothetical protein MSAN_01141000 [Mycena sanguinolenta]|uniref:Uncharacterized protein n=1 Tax=Mycena sanguinolenta TaxID=230812 RepID=A0A8H6YL71_9AGAR|nr:hypothetical protein MSAN_01141000 [Mycena sanguinolenta]